MMDSASTDLELRDWLRWACEEGDAPAFVRRVADAACLGCWSDYELLRSVLLELKRQHPQPAPGPSAIDDPELSGWLCWVSESAHVPSFVQVLVEAAFCACAGSYELLWPVLLEPKPRYPEA